VVLRSEESGFQVDHFRAVCNFAQNEPEALMALSSLTRCGEAAQAALTLEPQQVYGNILFHRTFPAYSCYLHLRATECVAEIAPCNDGSMYGTLPPAGTRVG